MIDVSRLFVEVFLIIILYVHAEWTKTRDLVQFHFRSRVMTAFVFPYITSYTETIQLQYLLPTHYVMRVQF